MDFNLGRRQWGNCGASLVCARQSWCVCMSVCVPAKWDIGDQLFCGRIIAASASSEVHWTAPLAARPTRPPTPGQMQIFQLIRKFFNQPDGIIIIISSTFVVLLPGGTSREYKFFMPLCCTCSKWRSSRSYTWQRGNDASWNGFLFATRLRVGVGVSPATMTIPLTPLLPFEFYFDFRIFPF